MPEMTLAELFEKASARLTREDASGARRDLAMVVRAGITSLPQLADAVSDANRDLEIRLTACSLLGLLHDDGATTALERALELGEDNGLVWEAAKALARQGAANAGPTLLRVLKQGNPTQQSAAAWVLGCLALGDAIPTLRLAALDPSLDEGARGHVVEALGAMKAREAVSDLLTLLSDASPELRYWAAFALGQIGDPVSIPALEKVASTDVAVLPHDRSVRQEALDALEAIRASDEDRTK